MCLTESHCGTDLGLLRTKAVPQADGTIASRARRFSSPPANTICREHHPLGLARMPDAPPGIKGISLFVVPKFLPNADGSVGPRNGVKCTGIEHKMGIKAPRPVRSHSMTPPDSSSASRTRHAGDVRHDEQRTPVGRHPGLGIGEVAYQSAVAYAKDRLQGRSLSGTKHPRSPPIPSSSIPMCAGC